jgi:hypothetical protein
MNNILKAGFVVVALLSISACSGSAKDKLGLRRSAPDEFRVISNAPLSVPPDFALRPLGAEDNTAKIAADESATKKILEDKPAKKPAKSVAVANNGATKGEGAFLNKAGADEADPQIKEVLQKEEEEQAALEKEKGFLDKLTAHSAKKNDPSIVNASGEKERIAKNLEDGKAVTEGETPTVTASKKGIFQNIFGL